MLFLYYSDSPRLKLSPQAAKTPLARVLRFFKKRLKSLIMKFMIFSYKIFEKFRDRAIVVKLM